MKFELNTSLEQFPMRSTQPDRLITTLKSKLDPDGWRNDYPGAVLRSDLSALPQDVHANYIDLVSECYSMHHAIKINPHDLWYVVLCEIASTVNKHSEAFRDLFTTSETKTAINVPSAHVEYLPLDLIIEQLWTLVPGDVDLFIPEFSTHTAASRMACYAAFADTVKAYYKYGTFMCGLPAVEIGGTKADWELFGGNLIHIALMMKPVLDMLPKAGTDGEIITPMYFHRAAMRIEMICDLFDGGSDDFVQDFYSHRNVGSGREKDVNGWIADFYVNTTRRLDNFNPCLSVVPYENLETGREFNLVYGAFGSVVEDGYRTAQYTGLVFEKLGADGEPLAPWTAKTQDLGANGSESVFAPYIPLRNCTITPDKVVLPHVITFNPED